MVYKIHIEKQGKPYPYDRGISNNDDGSIEQDPIISTKIKPLDVKDSNSEIERGEIVLDPETGAMHKALGKPHSQGGTPVSLKNNSFIFSNYKPLALSKNEKENFEFKMGGKYKAINNTPAKVLGKEVDLEHHNKMIDILQNEKKYSAETVNSAKLMMLKNLEKAGQVAYLQESKKHAPVPQFAQNSAPVYSDDTDQQITQSMQYLQAGGRKLTDAEIVEAEKHPLTDTNGWRYIMRNGTKVYYDKPGSHSINRIPPTANQTSAFNTWFSKQSPAFQADYIRRSKLKMAQTPGQFGYMNTPGPLGYTKDPNIPMVAPQFPQIGNIPMDINIPQQQFHQPNFTNTGNLPGSPKGLVDPTYQRSKLTPWQLINMGIPFARALNVKTQYPLHQHQESVIPQLDNINVQPQLDQNNQSYFNAASLTKAMNPNQGSSYLQQLFGNRIVANNQAIGNVDQANVQTQNRQKELVANTLNQDAGQNRLFDKNYYDQTQTAIKNAGDLREAYTDQGINTINSTMEKKLAFDSWLNMQQQYRGKATYVDKDGVQHYQGTPLYSPHTGFFGNSVQQNPVNIDWSNYQSSSDKVDSGMSALVQNMRTMFPNATDTDILKYLESDKKSSALSLYTNSVGQKKMGGRFIPRLRPKKSLF